jgi:hypothetical protein
MNCCAAGKDEAALFFSDQSDDDIRLVASVTSGVTSDIGVKSSGISVERDHHVDFDNIAEKVAALLSHCYPD